MGDLYQLQASSPVTLRAHQMNSALTIVMGYSPYSQPSLVPILTTLYLQGTAFFFECLTSYIITF